MIRYPDKTIHYDDQSQSTIEADSLCALIEHSIVERYSGELERHDDPCIKAEPHYVPLDTDAVRLLLNTLWGDFVAEQILDSVFATLIEDGAEHWPHGYCTEELEREREQKLSRVDHDIECVEKVLNKLKEQRNQLLAWRIPF